jgi:hypothetical protein
MIEPLKNILGTNQSSFRPNNIAFMDIKNYCNSTKGFLYIVN